MTLRELWESLEDRERDAELVLQEDWGGTLLHKLALFIEPGGEQSIWLQRTGNPKTSPPK